METLSPFTELYIQVGLLRSELQQQKKHADGMEDERYYSPAEVAKWLGMSVSKFYADYRNGDNGFPLPTRPYGSKLVRWTGKQIKDYLKTGGLKNGNKGA